MDAETQLRRDHLHSKWKRYRSRSGYACDSSSSSASAYGPDEGENPITGISPSSTSATVITVCTGQSSGQSSIAVQANFQTRLNFLKNPFATVESATTYITNFDTSSGLPTADFGTIPIALTITNKGTIAAQYITADVTLQGQLSLDQPDSFSGTIDPSKTYDYNDSNSGLPIESSVMTYYSIGAGQTVSAFVNVPVRHASVAAGYLNLPQASNVQLLLETLSISKVTIVVHSNNLGQGSTTIDNPDVVIVEDPWDILRSYKSAVVGLIQDAAMKQAIETYADIVGIPLIPPDTYKSPEHP